MKNILQIETIYNALTQLDYLVGLYTAYLLGAKDWSLFLILLGASLISGILTVKIYIKMMKRIVRK